MKNLFKKKINPTAPREFSEIEKEFQSLSAQAANTQYTIFVHTKELQRINERLLEVNTEASERRKLDAEVKAELDKKAASEKKDQPLDLTKGQTNV